MSSAAPPIQSAFVAVLAGTWVAGCLGPVHAAALVSLVFVLAKGVLRLRRLRPAGMLAPLGVLALLGTLRFGAAGDGQDMPPSQVRTDAPVVARIQVERVARRSGRGTAAWGRVLAIREGPEWSEYSPSFPVVIRHAGLLPVVAGTHVVARGRFRPRDARSDAVSASWFHPGAPPTIAVGRPADCVEILSGDTLAYRIDRARLTLTLRLHAALSGNVRDLVIAVLLGEGGGIDPTLREDLSVLGTAHVLAVSGLHVAAAASLVGLLIYGLAGPVWIRLAPGANLVRVALVAAALAATGMAAMAGWTPSATRAALMCVVGTGAVCAGRGQSLASLASLAATVGILRDPSVAFSLSFLMSYGAVFGLAFLVSPLEALLPGRGPRPSRTSSRPRRWLGAARSAFAASVAATLGTLPTTILAFGVASPLGPWINLIVLPTAAVLLMPCALMLAATAALWPGFLPTVAGPAEWLLGGWLQAQQWLSRELPSAAWAASVPSRLLLPAGALMVSVRLATRRWMPALVCGLALLGVLGASPRPPRVPAGSVAVTFLDVGKGDAVLVHCQDGATWLVDTAEERAGLAFGGLVPTLRALGITRLEGIVLTHADEDHVGGTLAVVRAMPVGRIVTSCAAMGQEPLKTILALAEEGVHEIGCLEAGATALPGCGDASTVLWPPPGEHQHHRNAASLVFRLEAGGNSILLTGDLETPQESLLVASGVELRADVLKLGHHGSPGASSPAFLQAVSPRRVIATGVPVRGRPEISPVLVQRVAAIGAHLARTFRTGWIRIGPWPVGKMGVLAEKRIETGSDSVNFGE